MLKIFWQIQLLESSILSNIPEKARSTEHFKKITAVHEEVSVRSPSADQLSKLLKLFSLETCDNALQISLLLINLANNLLIICCLRISEMC